MRHWIISAAVVLISSSFALAEGTKVLVAPFTEANEQFQPDWINRAIHQSVSDDLAALESVEVVPNNPAIALPSTAQAKGAGVQFIVRGTIQRLNGELRISGRVQNVNDGKTIGGFKATGPQTQLFAIEDSIARQLKRIVAPMEADPGLEDPRPIAQRPPTVPEQPLRSGAGGVFEGSELQRALQDRDYLNRQQRRNQVPPSTPVYYPPQPVYPATGWGGGWGGGWRPGCGYGGYGYGYGYGDGGDNNVVIINPPTDGNGGNGGGNGGGGGAAPPAPRGPTLQEVQTQRIRDAAVFGGANSNVVGPAPARAPVTNLRRTIPK